MSVLRVAWARTIMQAADVDGQSGQASGAGRKTGGEGEKMCLGTGAEWAPCGIVQEGGCHSGDV